LAIAKFLVSVRKACDVYVRSLVSK